MKPKTSLTTIVSSSALLILTLPSLGQDLDFGSKSDLWDISKGSVVTLVSGAANESFKPENMFGGTNQTTDGLPSFTFADSQPAGYVHFVEWTVPQVVELNSFQLRAQGDGADQSFGRHFAIFRLFAKPQGQTNFVLLYQFTPVPTHPYSFEDYDTRLVLSDNVPSTQSREFRAEFVQSDLRPEFNGPRVWELDGFTEPNEPTLRAFGAIELVWSTKFGRRYQHQFKESLAASEWTNYGAPFIGDGGSSSLLISTRATGFLFFRLVEVP